MFFSRKKSWQFFIFHSQQATSTPTTSSSPVDPRRANYRSPSNSRSDINTTTTTVANRRGDHSLIFNSRSEQQRRTLTAEKSWSMERFITLTEEEAGVNIYSKLFFKNSIFNMQKQFAGNCSFIS